MRVAEVYQIRFRARAFNSLWLSLLAWIFVSGLVRADDRVFIKQGQAVQGTISKVTPLEVVIQVRSKDQTFPLKDVRKIAFDKEPVAMDRARDLAMEGKFQQALDQLKTIPKDSLPDNPLLKQDYEFYVWYCEGMRSLAGTGDQNAAIKGLMSLDKVNPNSHHRWSIKLLLGRLALAKAAPARATEYFVDLAKSPDEVHRAAASYFGAKALLQQEKAAEAANALKGLLSATASSPEAARYKSLAAVLEARSRLKAGDANAALSALDGLAEREDNTDMQLFAEINNARGACYQALDQPQRAAYSYLQTHLLFFTDPETHAEALYHLKKLLTAIGQPAKAADAGEQLAKLYASSVWANKK